MIYTGEFNPDNGNIKINNEEINNSINKEAFINAFKNELISPNLNSNMFVFRNSIKINDIEFWMIVHFYNNKVRSVELENSAKDLDNSYNDWSNYRAAKKKESHDHWMIKVFQISNRNKTNDLEFNSKWGSVISWEDRKSGQIEILINYIW